MEIEKSRYPPPERVVKKKDSSTRAFHLVLYPDNPKHRFYIDKIINYCEVAKWNFCAALHDSDYHIADSDINALVTLKKEHYHIIVGWDRLRGAKTVSAFCKELGFEKEDFHFCKLCHNVEEALVYLTHEFEPPYKVRYDFHNFIYDSSCKYAIIIESNLKRYLSTALSYNDKCGLLLEFVTSDNCLSTADAFAFAVDNSVVDVFKSLQLTISNIIKEKRFNYEKCK